MQLGVIILIPALFPFIHDYSQIILYWVSRKDNYSSDRKGAKPSLQYPTYPVYVADPVMVRSLRRKPGESAVLAD